MASGKALEAGKSYEVSEFDGALLIQIGKAVKGQAPVKTKAKAKRISKAKADGV